MKKILTLTMVAILALTACSSDNNNKTNTNIEGVTYNVGMDLDYPPYEFIGEQGKPTGFEVELLQAIADDQNVKVAFMPIPWNLLIKGLNKQEYDIIIGGISEADLDIDSNADIDYLLPKSHVYAQDSMVTLTKNKANSAKDFKALKNHKVATIENSAWSEDLQDLLENDNLIEEKSSFLALQAVIQGKADIMLGNKAVIKYYQKSSPQIPLTLQAEGRYFKPYKIVSVVNENKKELVAIVNQGLKNVIKNGQYTRIYKKWFGEEPIKMPSV